MPSHKGLLKCLVPALLLLPSPGSARQTPPRKPPELIRDTGVADAKEEEPPKKDLSPALAQKSLKVANYYLKQRNYPAAIGRFQEAIEYQPDLADAYDGLARTYEKRGTKSDLEKALTVYKDFLKRYPTSPKAAEFRQRCAMLEKTKKES